jgi:DNA-directed RNA polymerase subunit RPC12/RpoP
MRNAIYDTRGTQYENMTIKFSCPKCGALIAFPEKQAGRRAKCLTCGQRFIIPAGEYEKVQAIKPEHEKPGAPLPGFYRAVFLDSWKLFFNPENITPLAFVVTLVCFRFFLAGGVCCLGYISTVVIWGWLIGYYLNIIDETAFDNNELPDVYIGTSITFLWYAIWPLLVFLYTMFIVQLPFIITMGILKNTGITPANMWEGTTGYHLLLQGLEILCLSLFPAAILTTAVGKDIMLLRPDYLLRPIIRGFVPYIVTVLLLIAAGYIELHTTQYPAEDASKTALALGLNLAVQVVAIIAMRSIGLFYRHYACYFKW